MEICVMFCDCTLFVCALFACVRLQVIAFLRLCISSSPYLCRSITRFCLRRKRSTMNKNPAQAEAGPSSSLPVSIRRRQAQQAIVRRAAQEAREETRRKREARHLDREMSADDTSSSMSNHNFSQAGPSECQHDNIDDDGLPDPSLPRHSPTPPPDGDFFLQRSPSPGPPPPDEDFFLRRSPSPGPPPDEDFFLRRSPSPGPPPPDEDFVLRRSPSPGPPPAQALPEHQRVAIDVDKLATLAILPKMKDTIEFIRALQNASLDDPCSKLNAAALHRLREPHQASLEINQPAIRFAISEYFALEHSAQDAYERIRRSAGRCFAGDANEIPSYYQIERLIAEFTGVESIEHDMCPESCVAFTGPFSHLENCPICGHHRYDPIKLRTSGGRTKVALRKFVTIPLGAQLQALWRDPSHAEKMSHLQNETERIFNLLREHGGQIDVFNDFVMGSDYIHAVARGDITKDDIVLMISMDGAQLYESKQSDCWIYIWVVMNHAPGERYQKKYVLPGGFIPGPNNPKNVDSFLFPGMHHLSALQKEGLRIWNASTRTIFTSYLHLIFTTADGPGLVYFDGMVGHSGKNGCRVYCGIQGRCKGTHYYPALLIPNNYHSPGSDHPDIDIDTIPSSGSSLEYAANLERLVAAPNETQYRKLKKETGLTKPSLLIGLDLKRTLGVPQCLTPDIMHLVQLLADLFLSLWRGKIDYTAPDHPSTWPWAIFRDVDMWQAHGAAVAAAGQYLPGSFDRKPRDPAQKINTGYKTWEFQIYIFGLGPALLFNVLPQPYWRNYCRIVRAFRLINQHSISVAELQAAHTAFNEWEVEFELLYYERRAERLHFIRPCVHQVSHLVTQTIQKGPPICYSQWTMERTVGNLGQEIRQPSNPYSNLSREGVRRCQVNALKAIIPELDVPPRGIPSTAIDLGGGYVLLRKRDYRAVHPSQAETIAIEAYLGLDAHKIHRWARLRLPNGQIVRTAWRETLRPPERPIRVSRNVKLVLDGDVRLAEVQYFTRLAAESGIGEDGPIWSWKDVAIVVMYSQPDADLLDLSFQAVSSCAYLEDDIRVVNIKSIKAVVGMVPHKPTLPSGVVENRFFLVEKPGLDIATFGVPYEGPGAQDDEDDDDEENMNDIE